MNREDFPMLKNDLIYFDNGATTMKPKCVIDAINDYYTKYCANAHRGDYSNSQKVDTMYETVREKIKNFIHAKEKSEIVFTSGTTDGLNRIVFGYFKIAKTKPEGIIGLNVKIIVCSRFIGGKGVAEGTPFAFIKRKIGAKTFTHGGFYVSVIVGSCNFILG